LWVPYQRLQRKTCAQNISNKDQQRTFFIFLKETKNIENWVALFLAELCKAEKYVQKDKQNQRRTELVKGCLAAGMFFFKSLKS
jgi:tryptophan 2,3-dioxygenase